MSTAAIEALDPTEITERPKPEPKAAPRRKPLTDAAEQAVWKFRKAVERLERIEADDRFGANREAIAAHMRGHLEYGREVCQDLLDGFDGITESPVPSVPASQPSEITGTDGKTYSAGPPVSTEPQAPKAWRRLPKTDYHKAADRAVQTLGGIVMGLEKLPPGWTPKAEKVDELDAGLARAIRSLSRLRDRIEQGK